MEIITNILLQFRIMMVYLGQKELLRSFSSSFHFINGQIAQIS
jgi:hypothetical protein